MKKNIPYSLLLLALLALASCEDFFDTVTDVDVEEHEPALVVFSFVEIGKETQAATVSHSSGATTSLEPRRLDNASISISRNGIPEGVYQYHPDQQIYQSDATFSGTEGEVFRLDVSAPGYAAVHARANIPPNISVGGITYLGEGYSIEYETDLPEYEIILQDDGAVSNYYAVEVYVYDTTGTQPPQWVWAVHSNDPSIRNWDYGGVVFKDDTFNGQEHKLRLFTNAYLDSDDVLLFRVYSIDEGFYRYITTKETYQENYDNPFADPINIYSNVEGGFGLFTIMKVEEFIVE